MVKKLSLYQLIFLAALSLIIINSCKKDDSSNSNSNSNNNNNNKTAQIAVLTTSSVNNITQTSAGSGGNISSDGGATVTARGVCWSTTQNPTISNSRTSDGSGTGSFSSNITGLSPNTTYYVKAYATNSAGTAYGNSAAFTTQKASTDCGTITDYDGNVYNTVTIGTQCWMKSNLTVKHYRNGDTIANVKTNAQWLTLTTGAWSVYYNKDSVNAIYGKYYNWYAVNDSRKICPAGWHIPSDAEWNTLIVFLGDSTVAGGKMKEAGTAHWNSPNSGSTNESGFTALPGGYRNGYSGIFYHLGVDNYFWSSTEADAQNAWYRFLNDVTTNIYKRSYIKSSGFYIRCTKD